MQFFRKTIRDLAPYVPGEQPRSRRYVKLNTNENPYPPSPRVVEALADGIGDRLRLYPMPMADDLRERAARLASLSAANVLVGNGSDDLLGMLARAVIDPGTPVAYPVPTYSLYDTLVAQYGGRSVHIPFGDEFDLPDALVSADVRMIFLANPNSPSGTMIPPDAVRLLAEREDRLVVVDEAYVDFADMNCLSLVRECPNVVVLRSLSKSYSLAGLRIGLGFAAEPVIDILTKVKDSYNVSRLSIVAGAAALRDVRWMQANVRRICATRDALSEVLTELGFEVVPSQANFVFARRRGEDLGRLAEQLATRGVLVRHFDTPELRDGLRITVGTDEEVSVLLRVLGQLIRRST